METVKTNIYKLSELSEDAKQVAIGNWRDHEDFQWIVDDARESFEKFADLFGITWSNIDYEEPYRNEYSFSFDDTIVDLSGQRLATWIWNNYKHDLYKGKYYGKLVKTFPNGQNIPVSKDHPIGQRHVKRYSKCQLENCCVLTGVCYDDSLLMPIYDFLDAPNDKIDIADLMNDCIYSFCLDVSSEINANSEDDAITETIEVNDYDFTEDGEMF